MRADLARRLARLEARRRPPAPPPDDTPPGPDFDAMSDDALVPWLASYEPPDDAAAELADLADELERMTDAELDAHLADRFASPEQETSRGAARS